MFRPTRETTLNFQLLLAFVGGFCSELIEDVDGLLDDRVDSGKHVALIGHQSNYQEG